MGKIANPRRAIHPAGVGGQNYPGATVLKIASDKQGFKSGHGSVLRVALGSSFLHGYFLQVVIFQRIIDFSLD